MIKSSSELLFFERIRINKEVFQFIRDEKNETGEIGPRGDKIYDHRIFLYKESSDPAEPTHLLQLIEGDNEIWTDSLGFYKIDKKSGSFERIELFDLEVLGP